MPTGRVIILATLAVAIYLGFYFAGQNADFKFWDADCYMRLIQAEELHRTGDWHHTFIPQSNAPDGETLHWTRPMDVILLAGAKIFQMFWSFDKSLLLWGIILSPLLLIPSALGIAWSGAAFSDKANQLRLAFLFLLQPAAIAPFSAGRPDHHSLLSLLFVFITGCLFHIAAQSSHPSRRTAWVLGGLLALSMWVSVESLVITTLSFGILAGLWLFQIDEKAWRQTAVTALSFGTLFLILDKPPADWFRVEYDRFSIVHLTLFGLAAVGGITAQWVRTYRFAFVFALGGISLVIIQTIFPQFFHGPYADMTTQAHEIWMSRVNEVKPLLEFSREGLARFLVWLGACAVAVPFLILQLTRWRQHRKEKQLAFIIQTLLLTVFAGLACFQVRWIYYAGIVVLFPYSECLGNVLAHFEKTFRGAGRVLARVSAILVFTCGFQVVGGMLYLTEVSSTQFTQPAQSALQASLAEMCEFLNEHIPPPARIAALVDLNPEILYRTPHETVSSPYHRNGTGIADVYHVMTAENPAQALTIIQRRGITHLLLHPTPREKSFYHSTGLTLYSNLLENNLPPWLQPVHLPEPLSNSFLLFEVKKSRNI